DRLLGFLGLGVVMRQTVVYLFETVGEERLEGAAGGGMELAALLAGQGLVRHLLSQRMLEHVRASPSVGPLVEELQLGQTGHVSPEGALAAPDALEEPPPELAAENGGRLEHALGPGLKPLDPGHQHVRDVARHFGQGLRTPQALDRAVDLLEEE